MKKLLIALLLVSQYSIAQTLEWGTTIGGSETEHARKVKTDSNGNVYLTGYFSGTTDFDPSANTFELTSNGEQDIFVLKLDANGSFVWAKSVGGGLFDQATSLDIDASGNALVTGFFEGTADFDPGAGLFNLTSHGDRDMFIVKLSTNGDLLWAIAIGGDLWDLGNRVVTDATGNVFIVGVFQDTVDFDPGSGVFSVTSNSPADSFILKLDSQADFVWVKTLDGNDQDSSTNVRSISLNSDGSIIVSGIFQGTMDVNPGAAQDLRTSNGNFDCFVVQLDSTGNFSWGNTHGNEEPSDDVWAANPDAQGNIYVTGYFQGTVDFDPGPDEFLLTPLNESNNVYLQKLDPNGNLLWAEIVGESSDFAFARAYDMTVDEFDNPVVLIKFSGTLDFNPGPNEKIFTSFGGYDIAIVKLNPAGEFKWAGHMGGEGSNLGLGIHSDENGNLYTTGYFRETIDLDPSQGTSLRNSNGQKDLFITKLRNPNLSVENPQIVPNLVVYPNPTSGQITITMGTIQSEVSVSVYNTLGQRISNKTIADTAQIELQINEAFGIYLLEIITNSFSQTLRIIKN